VEQKICKISSLNHIAERKGPGRRASRVEDLDDQDPVTDGQRARVAGSGGVTDKNPGSTASADQRAIDD
jgi:hypothetical protein